MNNLSYICKTKMTLFYLCHFTFANIHISTIKKEANLFRLVSFFIRYKVYFSKELDNLEFTFE